MTQEQDLSRNYRACESALKSLDAVQTHVVGNLFHSSIGGDDRDLIVSLIGLVRDRIKLRQDAVEAELLALEDQEAAA